MAYAPYDDPIGPRRQALMDKLAGGTAGIAPMTPPPIVSDQPPTAAPGPTRDFSRLTGYDQGKFDANKQDAKYQIGRTLSQFDPRQGITPDVLAGLNGLGYGTFAGSGDKLSLSGLTDLGKQNKLTGDYSGADFIEGFKGGNGKWAYRDPAAEAQQAPSAPQGASPLFSGSTINPMLHGDAQSGLAAALGNLGSLTQSSRLQQLIAALQGA